MEFNRSPNPRYNDWGTIDPKSCNRLFIEKATLTTPIVKNEGFFLHSSTPYKGSAFVRSDSNSRSTNEMPSRHASCSSTETVKTALAQKS